MMTINSPPIFLNDPKGNEIPVQKPLKIVFMGSAEFAIPALEILLNNPDQFQVVGVYSQPQRHSGRGMKLTPTPLHTRAMRAGLNIYNPISLKSDDEERALKALQPDFLVVVAYGLLLPQHILTIPKLGAINIHGSLLPKWRGAAPIQRSIEADEGVTGVTLIKMDAGLDTGNMLCKAQMKITHEDTTQSLAHKLSELGASLLPSCLLKRYQNPQWQGEPQQDHQASYATKIKKSESVIDFSLSAKIYDCRLRAFNPWPYLSFPCLWTKLKDGEFIKIKQAQIVSYSNESSNNHKSPASGEILSIAPLIVACGQGNMSIMLIKLQPPSKSEMGGDVFANQLGLKIGDNILG